MNKPFSQACENNQNPILEVLKGYVKPGQTILEIGSGTGQHACYMAQHLSEITWQPSDQKHNLEGILAWVTDANLKNLLSPIELNVLVSPKFNSRYDAVFTANTLHIMSIQVVQAFFSQLPFCLNSKGNVYIYGPFKYDGNFTSYSNERFDQHLKLFDAQQGIRDIEWVEALAAQVNLTLVKDHTMPANNQLLVFSSNLNSTDK